MKRTYIVYFHPANIYADIFRGTAQAEGALEAIQQIAARFPLEAQKAQRIEAIRIDQTEP